MQVDWIGSMARQRLAHRQSGRVLGVTSRGVFVLDSQNWVLFLSGEATRGPLTLNLHGRPSELLLATGDALRLGPEGLSHPNGRALLTLDGAKDWQAGPRPPDSLPLEEARARFGQVAAQIDIPLPFSTDELGHLSGLMRARQPNELAAGLASLLGRGPGLTPAGDDLALGLLLALNRWQAGYFPPDLPALLNGAISAAARRATTHLSASLIDCAALGQADERLVQALDGILTNSGELAHCAALLKGWGSTSGVSALQGMALAFQWGGDQPSL